MHGSPRLHQDLRRRQCPREQDDGLCRHRDRVGDRLLVDVDHAVSAILGDARVHFAVAGEPAHAIATAVGDPGGHLTRAAARFPLPAVVERVWKQYFIAGGKAADTPFKLTPMPALTFDVWFGSA